MVPDFSHLVGNGPVWFWTRTLSPTCSGDRDLVCSDHFSVSARDCFPLTSSLLLRSVRQARCGRYLFGWMGRRSLVGLPNTVMAGDCLVWASGPFLYSNSALWNLSSLRLPEVVVFPMMIRFIDFTPSSALQLAWGLWAEVRR